MLELGFSQAAEAGRGLGTTSSAPNLPGLAPLQRPPLGQGLPQPSAPGGATSSPRFANQTRSSQAAGRSSKEPGNAPGMASVQWISVANVHALLACRSLDSVHAILDCARLSAALQTFVARASLCKVVAHHT